MTYGKQPRASRNDGFEKFSTDLSYSIHSKILLPLNQRKLLRIYAGPSTGPRYAIITCQQQTIYLSDESVIKLEMYSSQE